MVPLWNWVYIVLCLTLFKKLKEAETGAVLTFYELTNLLVLVSAELGVLLPIFKLCNERFRLGFVVSW